jgi:hypothetical protein
MALANRPAINYHPCNRLEFSSSANEHTRAITFFLALRLGATFAPISDALCANAFLL